MKVKTALLTGLLAAVSMVAGGCSWFLLGGVGAALYSTMGSEDGDGGTVMVTKNAPPTGSIASPAAGSLMSDRVQVKYTLIDQEAEACSIVVEYSTDGGNAWQAATELSAYPSEGTSALAASSAGTSHTFVWNSFADLGNENYPDTASGNVYVRVRITPTDAEANEGSSFESGDFKVFNAYVSTFFGGELSELELAYPSDIQVVGGNKILVADEFQSRVVEIDLDTGALTTVAGTGNAGFTGDNLPADTTGLTLPSSSCRDAGGHLFIADTGAHRIRRVDAASNFITTFAGTGDRDFQGEHASAGAAAFAQPRGVAYDASRSILYVADTENDCIRAVNLGGVRTSVAGIWISPGTVATVVGNPGQSGHADGPAGFPGSVGQYASLRFGTSGHIGIAYYDETNGSLKYAAFDGTRWSVHQVDSAGCVGSHGSLALDASNRAHISYYDADNAALKYACLDTATGVLDVFTLDGKGDRGQYSSIAVNDQTSAYGFLEIFIAYYDAGNGDLLLKWFDGTDWGNYDYATGPVVDAGGTSDVGRYASLALEIDTTFGIAYPHVAYYNATDPGLMYRYWNPSLSTPGWADRGGNPVFNNTDDDGRWCSLALDSADRPHIAYFSTDGSMDEVCYTYWTGANWNPAYSVDGDTLNPVGPDLSLYLDAADHPHIVYYRNDAELWYGHDPGTGWSTVKVDGSGAVGLWASIHGPTGSSFPGVAYVERYDQNPEMYRLRFARKTASAWSRRFVDIGRSAEVDEPYALEVAPDGNLFFSSQGKVRVLNTGSAPVKPAGVTVLPAHVKTIAGMPASHSDVAYDGVTLHVAYTSPSTGKPKYASGCPGNYFDRQEIPDAATTSASHVSIALDAMNQPHIAYYSHDTRTLHYATYDLTTWTVETVDTSGHDVGRHASIALDASDNPHIAYYDATNGDLLYASRAGTWTTQAADSGTDDVGQYASLDIDDADRPHIAYYDATNGALKCVFLNGAWVAHDGNSATVDSTGVTGLYASLQLDNAATNQPHIAYYNRTQQSLRYAHFTSGSPGSWSTETVSALGNVGLYASLAVEPDSHDVFIACLNGSVNRGQVFCDRGSGWTFNFLQDDGGENLSLAVGFDFAGSTSETGYIALSQPDRDGQLRIHDFDFGTMYSAGWTTIDQRRYSDNFAGDGGPALDALFSQIHGLALTKYGTGAATYDALLVADADSSRIRAINLNDPQAASPIPFDVANTTVEAGRVQTLVGNGDAGYDPDDEGAVVNELPPGDPQHNPIEISMPQDVSVDAAGNIFIADSVNSRIRLVNTGATNLTACGKTIAPGAIRTLVGSDNTVAVSNSLFYPSGLAIDPTDGAIYVTDYIGYVFRIDRAARTSTVVAGSRGLGFDGDGSTAVGAEFWGAHDIAADREGNLYVLDQGNVRIRLVNRGTADYTLNGGANLVTVAPGNIDTILGTGVFTGELDGEGGSAADDLGDGGDCNVATTRELASVAMDTRASVWNSEAMPSGAAVGNQRGVLYVADRSNSRVRAINLNPDTETAPMTIAGLGTGMGNWPLSSGEIATILGDGTNNEGDVQLGLFAVGPGGMAIPQPVVLAFDDASGLLLVLCAHPYVLLAVNTHDPGSPLTTQKIIEVAGFTIQPGLMELIAGNPFNFEQGFNGDGIPARMAWFDDPGFMTVGRTTVTAGSPDTVCVEAIFIADRGQQRIRVIDDDGIIHTWAGTGEAGFNGDGVPPHNALVNEPAGIAWTTDGTNDFFFYVDTLNKRVRWQVK